MKRILLSAAGLAALAVIAIGLIRFGSRVDVYLPEGTEPRVIMGQKVTAGETILAEIGEQLQIEGIYQ